MSIIIKCKMCGTPLTVPDGKPVVKCNFCGMAQTVDLSRAVEMPAEQQISDMLSDNASGEGNSVDTDEMMKLVLDDGDGTAPAAKEAVSEDGNISVDDALAEFDRALAQLTGTASAEPEKKAESETAPVTPQQSVPENAPTQDAVAAPAVSVTADGDEKDKPAEEEEPDENETGIEKHYQHACALLKEAVTEDQFAEAERYFSGLGSYRDSRAKLLACQRGLENCRNDLIYTEASYLYSRKKYEEAAKKFESIRDYRDSELKISRCYEHKVQDSAAAFAASGSGQASGKIFIREDAGEPEPGKDITEKAEKADKTRKSDKNTENKPREAPKKTADPSNAAPKDRSGVKRLIVALVAIIAVLAAVVSVVFFAVIKPSDSYNSALEKMESRDYLTAASAFDALGDYKDSKSLAEECRTAETYENAKRLLDAGNYKEAMNIFESLGDYSDSTVYVKRITDTYYTFTVTLNADGGTCSESSFTAVTGEHFTLPVPEKTGNNFDGWYNGTEKVEAGDWPYTNVTELTAKWSRKTYKITLDANGGDVSKTTIPVEYEGSYTLPDPVRRDYSFAGWYCGEKRYFDGIWTETENIKLTAMWDMSSYEIVLDPDGGTVTETLFVLSSGESVTLPVPEKTGYSFDGWYFGTRKYESGVWTAGSLTLTAKWSPITYTLTLNAGGGEVDGAAQKKFSVVFGKEYVLPEPQRDGYTFLGWFNITTKYSGGVWDFPGNLPLTAKWIKGDTPDSFTVSLNANGGTVSVSSLTVTYGRSFTLPVPERSGYTFDGWYNGNDKYTDGIWTEEQNITLTAKWSVVQVTLSKISIRTMPNKTVYTVGESLDTTGLTLTGTYSDGHTETVIRDYSCSPRAMSKAGTLTVTVTYKGQTTAFNVTVNAKTTVVTLTSVGIRTKPTKLSYTVGESLSTSGLTLTAIYSDGSSKTVTSGFTCSPTYFSSAGTKTVTVTYSGKSAVFTVTVSNKETPAQTDSKVVTGISIKTNPSKIAFTKGSKLDTTGLTLRVTYSDGSSVTVSSGFTCTPSVLNTVGMQTVTVYYSGFTAQFNIFVS